MGPQDGATHTARSLTLGPHMRRPLLPPTRAYKVSSQNRENSHFGSTWTWLFGAEARGSRSTWLLCPGRVGENTAAFLQLLLGPGPGLTRSLATPSATRNPLKERR